MTKCSSSSPIFPFESLKPPVKYFTEIYNLGTFVAEIANASGAYTEEDLLKSVYTPWSTAVVALNQAYNEFYHVDVNGNEVDNFCYVTDSVLKYGINCVDFCMQIGFEQYEKSGKIMTNLPLNIDIQQILLHLFNFTILFGALYFLLYSPVVKFMKQREDYYKDLEDKAKANVDDTQKTKEEYEAKLAKADEEIKVIKTEAGEAAEKEHERIVSRDRKILQRAP